MKIFCNYLLHNKKVSEFPNATTSKTIVQKNNTMRLLRSWDVTTPGIEQKWQLIKKINWNPGKVWLAPDASCK